MGMGGIRHTDEGRWVGGTENRAEGEGLRSLGGVHVQANGVGNVVLVERAFGGFAHGSVCRAITGVSHGIRASSGA